MPTEGARPGSVGVWVREARPPFLTAAAVPVILGAVGAWYETGSFSPLLFVLTLVGSVLAQAGANMANDHFDTLSGNDNINRYRSQFNGGAGLIQDGLLTARQVHLGALACLGAAAAIGLYLFSVCGPAVLILMLLGGFAAYFYTGNPVKLAYHGVGEVAIGLCFGPFLAGGAYLVQAGTVSPGAVAASVPVGLLITAVLYINQFPDYEADQAVGKTHWVVRLGRRRALPGLCGLLVAAYLWIAAEVLLGLAPWPTLIALGSVPVTGKALSVAWRHYGSPVELRPANAMVIGAHLVTGLLLSAGLAAARILGV